METIVATAFGRVVDIQRGDHDELTNAAGELFRGADLLFVYYAQMILSKLHSNSSIRPSFQRFRLLL